MPYAEDEDQKMIQNMGLSNDELAKKIRKKAEEVKNEQELAKHADNLNWYQRIFGK